MKLLLRRTLVLSNYEAAKAALLAGAKFCSIKMCSIKIFTAAKKKAFTVIFKPVKALYKNVNNKIILLLISVFADYRW